MKIEKYIIENDEFVKLKQQFLLKRLTKFKLKNSTRTNGKFKENIDIYTSLMFRLIFQFYSTEKLHFKLNKFENNGDYKFEINDKKVYVKLLQYSSNSVILDWTKIKFNNLDYLLTIKFYTKKEFEKLNFNDDNIIIEIKKYS